MEKGRYLLPIVCLFTLFSCEKTIQKKYKGSWATTHWDFEFKKDGTYSRESFGHYGNTNVTGNYLIKKDTIKLLSGYQGSHGTVNEYYLINDDKLIDLRLRYDYKEYSASDTTFYHSQTRKIRYPQVNSDNVVKKKEVAEVVKMILNSPEFKAYIKYDQIEFDEILCNKYFFLDHTFKIDAKDLQYVEPYQIDSRSYLEFLDIDVYKEEAQVDIRYSARKQSIVFYCEKKKGTWTYEASFML